MKRKLDDGFVPEDVVKRFWSYVETKGEDECWNWKSAKDTCGYGLFYTVYKRCQTATRISWYLANGPIDNNLLVCHKCDNPGCVNPKHLFLGTNFDNMRDAYNKGKTGVVGSKGEERYNAKLTWEKVRYMRKVKQETGIKRGLGIYFSKLYKIDHSTICCVLNGTAWKEG